jgi:hypothetical protein
MMGDMAQVVGHWPRMHEVMGSISITEKKPKNQNKQKP